MGKIAIFGGTFDPPHKGHLNIAKAMLQQHSLDEIWFCPARYSPHKIGKECSPVSDRLKMVELAIEGNPKYKVVDFEIKRDGPSYTVDTLEELTKKYPQHDFYLILGDDGIPGFFNWRNPERIVQLSKLLIGSRLDKPNFDFPPEANPNVVKAIKEGLTPTPLMGVSSTEIREKARQGKSLVDLVPQKVIDYLISHKLYSQG